MDKKLVGFAVLTIILTSTLVPTSSSEEIQWWDNNWSSRQEIEIPIDTSTEQAKFQPIDVHLEFNDSCWAKSENENSIRAIFQEGSRFLELESQIYELEFLDEKHIKSCNVVFLIPKEANGNEKYYVYYDGQEKSNPGYVDHISIDESSYQFEPIEGISFDSYFYKIVEDGSIVYGVNKKGKVLGDDVSQQITKLKPGSTEIIPSNGDQLLSMGLIYWWYTGGKWLVSASTQKLVSKQVFVDGNLMIKFGIVSESSDGLLRSTIIYKYYYCPTENKRIHTHAKYELINYPLPTGSEIDVGFMMVNLGGIKSSTIKELNFGKIPPYLHFYSDEERIISYEIDQYPEGSNWQEMIGKEDDYDLGSRSWLSVDEGETGKAHGVIFESTNILKSGTDERDGIELQLFESNNVQLPGLDGRLAEVYVMRNAFEEGAAPDEVLPKDYVIEFNAEFFTSESGGYPAIDKEAELYQKLIGYQPDYEDNVTDDGKSKAEYNITAYVHLPLSLKTKLWGVKALLKNTYVSAELYDEHSLLASGKPRRIALTEDLKIDWRNFSLFKKISFTGIPEGRYIVKIWIENTLFGDGREFIGYKIIDLGADTTAHIYCKPEGKIITSVLDQDGKGVKGAKVRLIKDDFIILENESDSNGKVVLGAPCGLFEKYTLNVTYKGFLINEENIRLGRIRRILPLKSTINIDVYDLVIDVKDSKKKTPSFDLDLSLTSKEMQSPVSISPDSISGGKYRFYSLYPADYTLKIKYNQFEVKESLKVPDTESFSIQLHEFTVYLKDSWNLSPDASLDVTLTSLDFEKTVVLTGKKISSEQYLFSNLYAGNYEFKVSYKDRRLELPVSIPFGEDGQTKLTFSAEFNVTLNVFDSHGNPLRDTKVLIKRGEKESQKLTSESGQVVFSLPPGAYYCEIYSGDTLVAKRKLDVLSDKSYSVATTSEPVLSSIIIVLAIVLAAGAAIILIRKKDKESFLKILAISICVIALVLPWWAVGGSIQESQVKTSTHLFLTPSKMVTIGSNQNVTVGEIAVLDSRFDFVMYILPIIIAVGLACIGLSIAFKKFDKKRLSFLCLLSALMIFIGSVGVFTYAMSELASSTVGSLFGSGDLKVVLPGEKLYEQIYCHWGPSIGFYLFFVSAAILAILFLAGFIKGIKAYNLKKKNYKLH